MTELEPLFEPINKVKQVVSNIIGQLLVPLEILSYEEGQLDE